MPGGRAYLPPEPRQEDPRVRLLHGEPTAEGPSPGWGTPGPSQPQNPASRARSLPVSTLHDTGNREWVGASARPPHGLCAVPAPKAWPGLCPPALRGRQHSVGARLPASPFTTLPAGSPGTQSQLGLWLEGPPSRLAPPGGHISPRRVAWGARGMTASSPAGSWCPCCLGAPRARTGHVRATFFLQGYGRAQHSVSTEKIKAKYPDYEVTWADDGY